MYSPTDATEEVYDNKQVEDRQGDDQPNEKTICKLYECGSEDEEESEDCDDENITSFRSKLKVPELVFYGCNTIDEMVAALNKQIYVLEQLKYNGWKVIETIKYDYALLELTQK